MGKMIDVATAAAQLGVNAQRMRVLCRQRRVPGARLVGRTWQIPEGFVIAPRTRGPALGSRK